MFFIEVDTNSGEAIYIQLRNQIIYGIATSQLQEGDSLPSVRQLADRIGINMHTVNKAYTVLKEEGFLRLDPRRGAVVALDIDKLTALDTIQRDLMRILAWARCKNISKEEIYQLIEEIYEKY